MPREIYISASEWPVMEFMWEAPPHTLMEAVNALMEPTGLSKSTIITMIGRMEKKGLLRHEEGGRARIYYPAVSRDDAARRETKTLLDRVYAGSVGLLMNTLVDGGELSPAELSELYAILKRAEEAQND